MASRPFPPRGLTWFWFLNDECEDAHIEKQIKKFAKVDNAAVCLHPRAGLLLPYRSDDWFDFIRRTASKCADAGLDVWLYDEDPYPSGGAGGWLVAHHPEYEARKIAMSEAPSLKKNELFCFPMGMLLWAGLVDETTGETSIDLTSRVGVVRREWKVLKDWDSRWYYPATPRYICDRSETYGLEYALKAPAVPKGKKLVAFVAVPCRDNSVWGTLPDSFNPAATDCFIEMTHERYKEAVGDMFGSEIKAIFTDEPKYFGQHPWTSDMFESFAGQFGYGLPPRLVDLFSDSMSDRAVLTRLHYRQWCGKRFEDAWLAPVADWCRRNNLKLLGHISPEDDPVEQAATISNLFPLFDHFDMPGIDLIIPAVGDRDHPIINIGVVSASSFAQQRCRSGVMSESLGCSGVDFKGKDAAKIIKWQTVMGVTTPVIHGAFSSIEGHRELDAPPDFGPLGPRWEHMVKLSAELAPIQDVIIDARQIAPVAIIWPIRTFQSESTLWQEEQGGIREDLAVLILNCLERQVGVHLLDEGLLWQTDLKEERLTIGMAAYSHVIVPPCRVLHQRSIARLQQAAQSGLSVWSMDNSPAFVQTDSGLDRLPDSALPSPPEDMLSALPRAVPIEGDTADVRCTGWIKDGGASLLLMNIGERPCTFAVDGESVTLAQGEVKRMPGPWGP